MPSRGMDWAADSLDFRCVCDYNVYTMNTIVTTQIVKIGNSQGIRIPKLLLEQVGLNGTVQMEVEADCLILRPVHKPRQGWEEQFQRMAENGDDALLDANTPTLTKWDEAEWEW